MRHWMLSVLLADRVGSENARAQLAAALADHKDEAPLTHCLADPTETNCQVILSPVITRTDIPAKMMRLSCPCPSKNSMEDNDGCSQARTPERRQHRHIHVAV